MRQSARPNQQAVNSAYILHLQSFRNYYMPFQCKIVNPKNAVEFYYDCIWVG